MTAALPSGEGAVVWDTDRGGVRLRARPVRFPRAEAARPWSLSDRRGAARDRYGSWYAVTDDRAGIRVRPPGGRGAAPFWPEPEPAERDEPASPGAFRPATAPDEAHAPLLRGLAITTRHYLVVGTEAPAGLLVFDRHGGGPPQAFAWPSDVPFHPVDIAPRPTGGLWILDRAPEGHIPPRLWTLDRAFRVTAPSGTTGLADASSGAAADAPLFRTQESAAHEEKAGWVEAPLTAALAFDLDGIAAPGVPVAVEALPDDTVLVLFVDAHGAEPTSTVVRLAPLDASDPERGRVSLSDPLRAAFDAGGTLRWQAHDLAVRIDRAEPRPIQGRLYAVGRDGTQALVYDLEVRSDDLRLTLREQYVPLRRFGGRGLTAAGDAVYYDSDERWLPVAAQPRMRYVSAGQLATQRPFDGDAPGCVWHRVFLDACIPPDASVRIESRTADDARRLASEPWQAEPAPYLRAAGSEIPFDDPFGRTEADRDRPGTGTWEVLLQQATGRYLDLRLTLQGNGRTTPRLHALRLYTPRFSYLDEYLPDVYQSDPTSADFLERFLANPEGVFTAFEGRIAEVQQLFDTRTVPAEYLDWLGEWLGATFDADLDANRRRLFLAHAMTLYRQRGTVAGLLRLLRLALHPCPDATLFEAPDAAPRRAGYDVRIVEAFRTRSHPRVSLGDLTEPLRPRLTPRQAAWAPAQGGTALHARFRAFLDTQYDDPTERASVWPDDRFPPLLPAEGDAVRTARRADWRLFTQRVLTFPYAEITADDQQTRDRYRAFLQRRYASEPLPVSYGVTDANDTELPAVLPESGPRLDDWFQFVAFVLPVERAAHRFTVLVPARPDEPPATQTQRVDLVRRIVARERPAHTAFTVQPYWALFRVGAVRVSYDTILGESSRYAALVLDHTELATGVLAAAHPFGVADRRVVGRDAASSTTPL